MTVAFVGVDLAWGQRAETGLAAISATGDLIDMATIHGDDDIVEWVRRHAPGDVVVAFDAPLIVNNETGMRDCERLVGRYFGRFGVSCHASSRSSPAFADGGRAARLAGCLGLDVDPWTASRRRAVEVYPHTAIVQLFGLEERLRYKHKAGRDFAELSAELTRLLVYVESLATADPPLRLRHHDAWQQLRAGVATATRKHQLRAVEDAVDAVLCAYVAQLAEQRPDDVRVLGDVDSGYILTPVDQGMAQRIDEASGAGGGRRPFRSRAGGLRPTLSTQTNRETSPCREQATAEPFVPSSWPHA